jgi:hypothetical protein
MENTTSILINGDYSGASHPNNIKVSQSFGLFGWGQYLEAINKLWYQLLENRRSSKKSVIFPLMSICMEICFLKIILIGMCEMLACDMYWMCYMYDL